MRDLTQPIRAGARGPILLPFSAFVRMRVTAIGQQASAWDKDRKRINELSIFCGRAKERLQSSM